MQTTRVPALKVSSETIAKNLENGGFLRSVAGDEEFDKAVRAVALMFESGRGLFITGDAGCGKTQLLKALRKWLRPNTSLVWFYCKDEKDISALRWDKDVLNDIVFIDDIGCEEVIREYGNVVDVVGDFTQMYHYRGANRYMASTNLNSEQLNDRHGMRFLDRIMEMCVVLKMGGKSKRERLIVK